MFICHTYGAHVKEQITKSRVMSHKVPANGVLLPDWDQATAALQAIEFERVHDIWRWYDVDHLIVLRMYFL